MPALYSDPYHARKQSQAALRGKSLLILTSLYRKKRKGWFYVLIDRDFWPRDAKHEAFSKEAKGLQLSLSEVWPS